MNWKVGDKFYVDYKEIVRRGGDIREWKSWFPPDEAPFTIVSFYSNTIVTNRGLHIAISKIYHPKNTIVKQIIKDLL